MHHKLYSEKIATRLMIVGVSGFVIGFILSIASLFGIYDKVGDSSFNCTKNCTTDSLSWQTITAPIGLVITYVSIVITIVGVVLMIAASIQAKKQQPVPAVPYNPTLPTATPLAPAEQRRNVTQLVIRILASIAAFFITTSIAVTVVSSLVMKDSSKTINQQGHLFAYIIIVVYPLVGGFSAYFTNKYLKQRLNR
jgi:hypothetical protein